MSDIHLDSSGTNPADALRMENEKLARLSANPPEEIFTASDFHLGNGRNPETGRYGETIAERPPRVIFWSRLAAERPGTQ